MKPVIFISSHPIQYFAPLYQSLAAEGLPVEVYYCSRHGLDGETDREFGNAITWDIPLLTGYRHRFFKSYFTKPSIYSFFGLINLGIVWELIKAPPSIVVIHGWRYLTNILAMVAARLSGHTVCLRGETPLHQELKRSRANIRMRKILLRRIVFPWFSYFLYIGKENKAFYLFYGVKDKRLLPAPYAVDNTRFKNAWQTLSTQRNQQRGEMNIPQNGKIILFSGKYIEKKRPLDVLKAFKSLHQRLPSIYLYMVGDGNLRTELEDYQRINGLKNVVLTGFINQQEIAQYYSIADVFTMCSGLGETWGLSVNEAMNFSLPLVLSDLTGCSADLVKEGKNGYVFKTGDVDALEENLYRILTAEKDWIVRAGQLSADLVSNYSFHQTAATLRNLSACAS